MSYAPNTGKFNIGSLAELNPTNIDSINTLAAEDVHPESMADMPAEMPEFERIEPAYYIRDCVMDDSDCFSGDKIFEAHYGGDQEDLARALQYGYLEDCRYDKILEILKGYFPNITDDEVLAFLQKMGSIGCGYTAAVNTLFATNPDPQKFEDAFGIPLTYDSVHGDGTFSTFYNYELLLLEFFLFYGKYEHGFQSYENYVINSLPGDEGDLYLLELDIANEMLGENRFHDGDQLPAEVRAEMHNLGLEPGRGMEGTASSVVANVFQVFLEEHGYTVDVESFSSEFIDDQKVPFSIDVFREALDDGKMIVIDCDKSFEFYIRDDVNGDGLYNDFPTVGDGVYGHAVMVVGTTPDGQLLVTSWGSVFIVDPKYVDTYALYSYH